MSFFGKAPHWRTHRRHPLAGPRARLQVEALESRVVPYALSGGAWPHPELVTISFVPDGTIVGVTGSGYATSNLFQKLNAKFGSAAVWQAEILRAAQSWAQQTNLNFTIVADNGTPIGQGGYQQGDSGMGDVRIGGYYFGTTTLAQAYMPPPLNNYSIAGDVQFNTGLTWNINGFCFDVFTVAAHEFGHTLGLNHSLITTAEMFGLYTTAKRSLAGDDIDGIRAVYSGGARGQDAYDAAASNGTVTTATDVNSLLDPTALTALVTGDVTTTTDADYYTVSAPATTSGTFTVNVQSTGLSLLTPAATVYAADGSTVLASASGSGQLNGSTLAMTVNGVTAGQQFYVKVAGAGSTAFSTGKYAMTLNFGSGASPTVPVSSTQTLNGNPIQGGGGQAEQPGHKGGADGFAAPDDFPLTAIPMDRVAFPASGRVDAGLPVIDRISAQSAPNRGSVIVSGAAAPSSLILLGGPGGPELPSQIQTRSPELLPEPREIPKQESRPAAPPHLLPGVAPSSVEAILGQQPITSDQSQARDSYFAREAQEAAPEKVTGPAEDTVELGAFVLLAALAFIRDEERGAAGTSPTGLQGQQPRS